MENLFNSLIGKKFQDYIAINLKNQQQKKLKNQNISTQAKPQFINIFKKSKAVSITKGKSHFVMRLPNPPKTSQGKEYVDEIKYGYENIINKLQNEMDSLRC